MAIKDLAYFCSYRRTSELAPTLATPRGAETNRLRGRRGAIPIVTEIVSTILSILLVTAVGADYCEALVLSPRVKLRLEELDSRGGAEVVIRWLTDARARFVIILGIVFAGWDP